MTPSLYWTSTAFMAVTLLQTQRPGSYQPCSPLVIRPIAAQEGELLVRPGPEGLARDLNGIIETSTVIAIGRVAAQECRIGLGLSPANTPKMVDSKYELTIEKSLFGSTQGAKISFLIRGSGRLIDFEGHHFQSEIEDFDAPKIGDRLLVFLKPATADSGVFDIAAWGEGIFQLTEDGTIRSPWRGTVQLGDKFLHGRAEGQKSAKFIEEVTRNIRH